MTVEYLAAISLPPLYPTDRAVRDTETRRYDLAQQVTALRAENATLRAQLRRAADLDGLTDDEADRIAVQLNRRAACDPVVLASVERINDYHPVEYR